MSQHERKRALEHLRREAENRALFDYELADLHHRIFNFSNLIAYMERKRGLPDREYRIWIN